jgi:hypothetical protein
VLQRQQDDLTLLRAKLNPRKLVRERPDGCTFCVNSITVYEDY